MVGSIRHWSLAVDGERIGWLTLDKADSSSNTLSQGVLEGLDAELGAVEAASLAGLVVRSAKPTGFIVGADVKEFAALRTVAEGSAAARRGQVLMARIAALDCPTVALLDGFALGGGLELALACDYRIAALTYERSIGLPEVQLGIHPGFGGTVRVVEIAGPLAGLELMLSGRLLAPREAEQLGLVDRVVEREALEQAARDAIGDRPRRRRAPWYLRALNITPLRQLTARVLRARIARRASPIRYPAPFAMLDLWLAHGARGDAAYVAEAESIGRLFVTSTSKNLVRVFGLRERLRRAAPKTAEIRHVHVIGAGVMGGDIAAWCAAQGIAVSLQDRTTELIAPALERAARLFARRLKGPGAAEAAQARLKPDVAGSEVAKADLVLEAIVEKLDVKQTVFRACEANAKRDAVIASNTSSLRIEDMAVVLTDPERFVGIHFFNPVAQLPLVEVVRGEATSDRTFERALSFVIQIGKLPLPCRSAPGFVVNRILTPYMLEALRAHEDGHALETIDAAARAFGMPVGPIELADQVGLDTALHVARVLAGTVGAAPPALLEAKVESGHLGVKSGRGFYSYVNGRPTKARAFAPPTRELEDRLILPLVNAAVACWGDGVVAEPDLVDAAVVFGTGFAPYTGGPLHYAKERGIDNVVARLRVLAAELGPRFEPSAAWGRLSSTVA